MLKILHNKIPMVNGNFEFPYDAVQKVHNSIREAVEKIDSEYIVLTTPTELSVVDGDAKIVMISAKEYSYNELKEIIEKANKYDDLCK